MRAVDRRQPYIRQHGLDEALCLPSANWEIDTDKNDYASAYRHLRDGGYAAMNRLRFYCQVFSGYNLMSLRDSHGLPSVRPIPSDLDDLLLRERPEPDVPIERWRAVCGRLPERCRFKPKTMLGEIGWLVDGVIVNHDTLAYQERVAMLHEAGVLDRLRGLGRPPRILEIGGGYGALAYALADALGPVQYVICDLPESLVFSGLYLRLTRAEPVKVTGKRIGRSCGFTLLPNYKLHLLSDARFDLAINTISMSEMSEDQVEVYARGLTRMLRPNGVFFEQNHDHSAIGLTNAGDLIARHFCDCRTLPMIQPKLIGERLGTARLWRL